MQPRRLLDLFCGGGGAGSGYALAGWHITGVDLHDQPEYPGEFILGDALDYLEAHGHTYDAIHASPPCQGYSAKIRTRSSRWSLTAGRDEPRLITTTRTLLARTGRPWVIENIIGARHAMAASLLLCGTMFGLPIQRHRIFECSHLIMAPAHGPCHGVAKRFAAARGWDYRDMRATGKGRRAGTAERWSEILGIRHPMRLAQLAEAIPPAYTHFIGQHLTTP